MSGEGDGAWRASAHLTKRSSPRKRDPGLGESECRLRAGTNGIERPATLPPHVSDCPQLSPNAETPATRRGSAGRDARPKSNVLSDDLRQHLCRVCNTARTFKHT